MQSRCGITKVQNRCFYSENECAGGGGGRNGEFVKGGSQIVSTRLPICFFPQAFFEAFYYFQVGF